MRPSRTSGPEEGLVPFGWDEELEKSAAEHRTAGRLFGRVAVEHREKYLILTAADERPAEVSGRFLFDAGAPSDFPKVGDWSPSPTPPRGRRPSSMPSCRGGAFSPGMSPEKKPRSRFWPPMSTSSSSSRGWISTSTSAASNGNW